ncbi:hypothetical protein W97_05467 [Coniosporium apollinis CBS 100218]|uniref:Uncharacterized protein n=1 Tax=Coniosporium apollinis (strain CBS 100218) TaxID=1168221 RepID=R7YWQ7_CONA1|nr:uncharacterized protein W97_05467 [Coniosporium apollinis CBS 100218]EON66370.1 hypothetical protein W97_05467 [Coniosporium apollinis CBS 100218]
MSNPDPQRWVWPPGGEPYPPTAQTGSFGPIHLNDKIVVSWTPSTTPDVALYCLTPSNVQTGVWVSQSIAPPVTYQFDTPANRSDGERIFCHMTFEPSTLGNTVVWEFLNEAAEVATTWTADSPSSAPGSRSISTMSTGSNTVTSTQQTSASSATMRSSQAHSLDIATWGDSTVTALIVMSGSSTQGLMAVSTSINLSAAASSSSSQPLSASLTSTAPPALPSGLSAAAGAGIGVGAVVGVAVLAGFGFMLWRRRRRRLAQRGFNGQISGTQFGVEELPSQHGVSELRNKNSVEVQELSGDQGISELSGSDVNYAKKG